MLRCHVTKYGRCAYCGSLLRDCIECGEPFHAANKVHIYCSSRCRMRASRKRKVEEPNSKKASK